jgi:uncharacterized protein
MVFIEAAPQQQPAAPALGDLSTHTEHIMKCPHCPDATLTLADRQGVEIDYCPQCRGVWLDRGELDKLIERADSPRRANNEYGRHAGGSPRHTYDGHDSHGRRRKSWLSELFD